MRLISELPDGYEFAAMRVVKYATELPDELIGCVCVLRKIAWPSAASHLTGFVAIDVVYACDVCRRAMISANGGWSGCVEDGPIEWDPLVEELEETFGEISEN